MDNPCKTPIKNTDILSNDKVDVEIEPDVKANKVDVNVQLCSCSLFLMFQCFSKEKEDNKKEENKKEEEIKDVK